MNPRAQRRADREERREENMRLYGTNIPNQEQKAAVTSALRDAGRFQAASAAGYSPPTPAASGQLLQQRIDLFGRMQSAGASEAAKMREEARGLGVTSAGFDQALGRVGPAPTAPPVSGAPPATGSLGGGLDMKSARRPELVGNFTTAQRAVMLDKDREADIGGTEMDRTRAQAIVDIRRMSEGEPSVTREGALEEINKARYAEGKVPLKIDFKDVAAVDKAEAEGLRERDRVSEAGIRELKAPTPSVPFVHSAEMQQRLDDAKYNLVRMQVARDALNYEAPTEKTIPKSEVSDRTFTGDVSYLRKMAAGAALNAVDTVGRVGAQAVDATAQFTDEASTDAINYLLRQPGEAKTLTKKELEELRRALAPK